MNNQNMSCSFVSIVPDINIDSHKDFIIDTLNRIRYQLQDQNDRTDKNTLNELSTIEINEDYIERIRKALRWIESAHNCCHEEDEGF